MNKKINFGSFFTFLFMLSLTASVKKEFDEKLATDSDGKGINLIFAKAEVEAVFGEKNFWGIWSDQKESTFLHQALLVEDEKVRSILVNKILKVPGLDVEKLLKFQDQAGKTPLHLAVEKSDLVSIHLFLKKEEAINAAQGAFDIALNTISIADNQGLTSLDVAEKNSTILDLFKKHIHDQNLKYNSFIGTDMLAKIERYLAAIKSDSEDDDSKKDEKDVGVDSEKSEKGEKINEAQKEVDEQKKTEEFKTDDQKKIEESRVDGKKKTEELKVDESQKDQLKVEKDEIDKTTEDVGKSKEDELGDLKDEIIPPSQETMSLLKPSLITLFVVVSCCSVYTAYEWYEDYCELSEKNKESKEPLTESELRALAWKRTKKRFFECFE